ncbi:hypothetical protein [Sinosporangium siamense]|nr:hypothetical protein [Sinosporangium siamense]
MATALASVVFQGVDSTGRTAVMVLTVGMFAATGVSALAALATGVIAWLFTTGFLVNTAGELSLSASDALRLVALVCIAAAGAAASALFRQPLHEVDPTQENDDPHRLGLRVVPGGEVRNRTVGDTGPVITSDPLRHPGIVDLAEARVRMQGLAKVPTPRRTLDLPAAPGPDPESPRKGKAGPERRTPPGRGGVPGMRTKRSD